MPRRKTKTKTKKTKTKKTKITKSPLSKKVISTNQKKSYPLDAKLWQHAKQEADRVYQKPSAYKSGFMVKLYKKLGGQFGGQRSITTGLTRWYAEKWTNQRGETGYQKKGDLYRPQQRITNNTPRTWQELSSLQIKKAQKQKMKQGRVTRF